MRKIAAAAATAVIASSGFVAVGASPAAAGSPNYVTRAEYERLHLGVKKPRVHRIFDFSGRFLDGGAVGYTRYYRECHPRGGDGSTVMGR